tara:strand:+ start:4031 stop:4360 length:330 start_codon:yes stop_codon:yes gene_type:complete
MKNKYKIYVLGVILVGAFAFGYYTFIQEKHEIDKNGEIGEAVITKVYYLSKRGYFVNYEYTIENKDYSGSQEFFKGNDPKVGQRYKIKYSTTTPKYSRILFSELIEVGK